MLAAPASGYRKDFCVNLEITEEQRLLKDSVAKLFAAQSTPRDVRAAEPRGFAPKLWQALVNLGIPLMRAPEAVGGAGSSLLDAALVAEEAGRHLASVPLIETIAAARLLAAVGDDTSQDLLARMRDGKAIVTLALHPCAPGTAQIVPAGGIADIVICVENDVLSAVTVTGMGPVADPVTDAGMNGVSLGALPVARLRLAEADVRNERRVLASGANVRGLHESAVEEWRLLKAAVLAGASHRAVELAADYARERKQFGRTIGSFQAIAHPLADSITDIEGARLMVWWAIWSNARGRADAAAATAMASWWASDTGRRAVQRALRTFGGYGLALEYDIQLYFRRINGLALLDGDPLNDLTRAGDRLWGDAKVALPPAGDVGIDIGFGTAAEQFAAEARRFFEENLTPALRAKAHHSTDGHDPAFHKLMAKAGFAYPDWPKTWGGQERGPFELSALARVFEEFRWTRVPIGITNMGARMAMMFGVPELQAEVMPRLADGSALSCLGFSEPSSGSDMYAAQTRAVKDGDDWIINGQKMFTTGAHISDYVLLLARTDPNAAKHKGLTVFLVPLNLPGIEIQALHTLQDERTNITYYADVRLPDRYRLGPVNGGLKVMAATMSLEHSGEGYHILQNSLLDAARTWAFAPNASGQRPIDQIHVRQRLAKVATHTQVADLLCRRSVWSGVNGHADRAIGPMSKLFATESYMEDAADLVALAAPESIMPPAGALHEIEEKFRQSIGQTIYGGTSEVHRGIIAENALKLARAS
jgi:alkylation response protein AidB-like acyl-CoA dehydrogenase